ncbi:hypothetical protein GCM10009678_23300 [Actinomadura kijaniata]
MPGRPRGATIMPMDVSVQWVRTSWTKRSRGAPGAVRRNACPLAFPLPDAPQPFLHRVTMAEWEDFRPRFRSAGELPPTRWVRFEERDGLLVVGFPGVTGSRPRSLPLRRRQTLRLRTTWAESVSYYNPTRIYHHDTFNIAYGPVSAEVFLRPPSREVDLRPGRAASR